VCEFGKKRKQSPEQISILKIHEINLIVKIEPRDSEPRSALHINVLLFILINDITAMDKINVLLPYIILE